MKKYKLNRCLVGLFIALASCTGMVQADWDITCNSIQPDHPYPYQLVIKMEGVPDNISKDVFTDPFFPTDKDKNKFKYGWSKVKGTTFTGTISKDSAQIRIMLNGVVLLDKIYGNNFDKEQQKEQPWSIIRIDSPTELAWMVTGKLFIQEGKQKPTWINVGGKYLCGSDLEANMS
jgi:hypothetical protein